jgi:hypothetical protein
MDSFDLEFGAGEKISRAGRSRPLAEAVVGPTPPSYVSQGPRYPLDKTSQGEIGGVKPSFTPPTGKIILAV